MTEPRELQYTRDLRDLLAPFASGEVVVPHEISPTNAASYINRVYRGQIRPPRQDGPTVAMLVVRDLVGFLGINGFAAYFLEHPDFTREDWRDEDIRAGLGFALDGRIQGIMSRDSRLPGPGVRGNPIFNAEYRESLGLSRLQRLQTELQEVVESSTGSPER